MIREVIQPKKLSDPRPRYSQAILTKPGRLLFIAGQTALDDKGRIIGKGDIEKQVRQVLENIKEILHEAGGTLENIVHTVTYTTNIKYRQSIHEIRSKYFKDSPPTSTFLVVKGLARKEFLVEIEGIAIF